MSNVAATEIQESRTRRAKLTKKNDIQTSKDEKVVDTGLYVLVHSRRWGEREREQSINQRCQESRSHFVSFSGSFCRLPPPTPPLYFPLAIHDKYRELGSLAASLLQYSSRTDVAFLTLFSIFCIFSLHLTMSHIYMYICHATFYKLSSCCRWLEDPIKTSSTLPLLLRSIYLEHMYKRKTKNKIQKKKRKKQQEAIMSTDITASHHDHHSGLLYFPHANRWVGGATGDLLYLHHHHYYYIPLAQMHPCMIL